MHPPRARGVISSHHYRAHKRPRLAAHAPSSPACSFPWLGTQAVAGGKAERGKGGGSSGGGGGSCGGGDAGSGSEDGGMEGEGKCDGTVSAVESEGDRKLAWMLGRCVRACVRACARAGERCCRR
jgi:hypothetical protein